jgi:hypothetical protein
VPGRHQQQRVSVRLALGDEGGTEGAAGAGLAFHQHRLAEPFAQDRGEQPGQQVHRATAAEAVHDAQGPRRPRVLGLRRMRGCGDAKDDGGQLAPDGFFHFSRNSNNQGERIMHVVVLWA